MICPGCGENLPENAAFCATCGHKIKSKKNQKLRKILLWSLLGVLALAILGGVLYWFFGMKTVYLVVEESVVYGYAEPDQETTYEYEYTATGKLKSATMVQGGLKTRMEYTWEGGKIVSGKLRTPEGRVVFHYNYDANKLESVKSEMVDGVKVECKCNGDGLIDEVITYREGNAWNEIDLTYYKTGRIKTFEQKNGTNITFVRYDHEGRTLEYKMGEDDRFYYWYECRYDDGGHITAEYQYDGRGNLIEESEYVYTFNGDEELTDLYMLRRNRGTEFRVDYAIERSGADTWVRVEAVSEDMTGYTVGDHIAYYRKDEDGNIVEREQYSGGKLLVGYTYKYKKIRVPKSYIAPQEDSKYLIPLVQY